MLATSCCAGAQFDLEDSHTTVSLRGIDALGAGIAWASGSNGTVLRTEDGGYLWQTCAMPKGAEKLDFRGVQGFDAKTAVVMSSGPGMLSKIYKTTDGCQTWKPVFENPDADGFFDTLKRVTGRQMYLLGDPVGKSFAMFYSADQGEHWSQTDDPGREAAAGAGAFAASNSSLASAGNALMFGTSATTTEAAKVYRTVPKCPPASAGAEVSCSIAWMEAPVPVASGSTTAGIYSLALRTSSDMRGRMTVIAVAVGGNYEKPADGQQTAAFSIDGGVHWAAAKTMPGGYRSGVAYEGLKGRWIAVGPTGADESRDDGLTWSRLLGASEESANGGGWNAISLPFVVGEKGRIGKLRDEAKESGQKKK